MKPASPIRVVLIDDSAEILGLMRRSLEREGMSVVTTLSSADTLLAALREQHPDVVVMDLTMPGKPPLEAIAEAVLVDSGARFLVMSAYDDAATVSAAVGAGASGFISKDADLREIVRAIREAASGRTFVTRG